MRRVERGALLFAVLSGCRHSNAPSATIATQLLETLQGRALRQRGCQCACTVVADAVAAKAEIVTTQRQRSCPSASSFPVSMRTILVRQAQTRHALTRASAGRRIAAARLPERARRSRRCCCRQGWQRHDPMSMVVRPFVPVSEPAIRVCVPRISLAAHLL